MENNDVLGQKNPSENELKEDWRGEIRVTYSVFSGGENSGNIRRAKAQLSRELIQYEKALNTLIFTIKKAFYEAMLYSGQVDTQMQIIELLEKEVERQERLFDVGKSTKFNIVRTQVRLANERPRLIEADKKLTEAGIDLVEAMGMVWNVKDGMSPLQLSGELSCPPVNLNLNNAVRTALTRRPDARELDLTAEIAAMEARVARSSNIPKIDLFAQGISRRDDGSGSSFFDNSSELAFGFLGQWDIFDGFRGKGRAKQADARRKQAEIRKQDTARRITLEVTRAFGSLQKAQQLLGSQAENVERAKQSIELARSSVDAGFSSQFDVIQATVDYNQALNIEIEAKFEYHESLAELERALFSQTTTLTPEDVNYESEQASFRAPEQIGVR